MTWIENMEKGFDVEIKKGRKTYLDFGTGGHIYCVPLQDSILHMKLVPTDSKYWGKIELQK